MPRTPFKGLFKSDPDNPNAALEPGKVSEMILEFARPLLDLEPGGPPDINALRNILMFAELCWNLPVYERAGGAADAEFKKGFDRVLQAAPEAIASRLRQLVQDRKTRFAAIPFLITARVEGESLEQATVVAEARVSPRG